MAGKRYLHLLPPQLLLVELAVAVQQLWHSLRCRCLLLHSCCIVRAFVACHAMDALGAPVFCMMMQVTTYLYGLFKLVSRFMHPSRQADVH